MKAKIILYGWVISWIPMVAGLGTMDWALATGDKVFIPGFLLFMVFVVFSWLVVKHQRELVDEVQRFDQWFDRMLEKINKLVG